MILILIELTCNEAQGDEMGWGQIEILEKAEAHYTEVVTEVLLNKAPVYYTKVVVLPA